MTGMKTTQPFKPRRTLLGKTIMFGRAIRTMLVPPSTAGMTFMNTGTGKSVAITLDFDASPDAVWAAVWQTCIIQPPHASIEDVRAGDTFAFYWEATGSGHYWSKAVCRCTASEPGRRLSYRLLSLDDWPDARLKDMSNDYVIEPLGRMTRLTIRAADEQADAFFEPCMAAALNWDSARIRASLGDGARSVSPIGTPRTPHGSGPPRRNSVTRA